MKNFSVVFCLSFIALTVKAQTQTTDTLQLASLKVTEKKLDEASHLLTIFNSHHDDQYGIQLEAHILYLLGQPARARSLYERGMQLFPQYAALQLDYGRMMFQLKRFQIARTVFLAYLKKDQKNAEANISVAFIDLWNGHVSSARKRARYLLSVYPGNKEATGILQQIQNNTALYVNIKAGGYTDDQPMQGSFTEAGTGVYKSWWLSPYVTERLTQVTAGAPYRNSWFTAGDHLYIGLTKTTIDIAGGYFSGDHYQGGITSRIALTEKLFPAVSVDASTEKMPYQYTLASVKSPFLYRVSEAGLNLGNLKWLARAAYQNQSFEDGNSAATFYAWLLAPVVHLDRFSVKTGYSFSYANADKNTFEPKNGLGVSPVLNSQMEGAYNPYFTPSHQYVNAVLLTTNFTLSKAVSIFARASYGFYAMANQPSLIVSRNGSGPFFAKTDYNSFRYHPAEIHSGIRARVSAAFYIDGQYTYNSLIFFKSNSARIGLKYLFINGKTK